MAANAWQVSLALLFAAALGFSLQGCGGNSPSPSPSPPPSPPSPSPPSPSPSKARKWSEVVTVPGWPDLKGKFPLSFAVKAGSVVYVSGMQGMDMKSMKLVPGGVKEETRQTLSNLQALLEAANSSMKDVTQCSVSMMNITRDFKDMNEAYAAFWPHEPPARTAVQVPAFPDLAAKGFPISWATKVDGMVYMSGMQGRDMKTQTLAEGGVAAETTQALKNLQPVLEAANSSSGRVVGCSVSLANMSDFKEMNEAYKAFWPTSAALGGLPTRVCVEVASLGGGAKVEIQCTAAGEDVPGAEVPKAVKVPGWPEMKGFPFSAAARSDGIAYISGNQGVDMRTSKMVEGGAGPETTQTLRDIKEAVEASGTGLEEVVACEVSLRSMKDFAEVNKAYAEFWPHEPPSRVAVQVGSLARGAAVEIRCAAALPLKAATAKVLV